MVRANKGDARNVKIMIGGAPINEESVQRFGADGTADDAPSALREAINFDQCGERVRRSEPGGNPLPLSGACVAARS